MLQIFDHDHLLLTNSKPKKRKMWKFHFCHKPKLSRKKSKHGGIEGILFWKRPLEFLDLSLHPWKFHKIVLHPLQFPRPKIKAHGNLTWFFLDHPWKFHFFFHWPLEFPRSIFFYKFVQQKIYLVQKRCSNVF